MTQFKRFSIFAAALCFTLLIASCDSGFEEMNVNPTQADQISPDFKLTYLQLLTSGGRYENWRTNLIYSSTMIQHFATLPTFWSGDKYLYNSSYSAALWDRFYENAAKNFEDLLVQTSEDPAMSNMNHIANILFVIGYHRLTDLYGDIPYSEAGKGFTEGIPQPKYDAQSFIYPDMLARLEAAATGLDDSKPSFGNGDLIYGGDVDQWRKLANSMMLRLGMRLVKVDEGAAQSWAQKAIAGGTMESNDDIASIPHGSPPSIENGNGEVFRTDGSPRLSQFFVNWMVSHEDPRLFVYGQTPIAGSDPIGLPNGRISGGSDADFGIENHSSWVECQTEEDDELCGMNVYMVPNDVIKGTDDPVFLMTYAEVELLKAEAAVRGWHSGDAAAHYANGVRAAMQYLALYGAAAEIADADIDEYLTANPYDASEGLKMINEQIWAAVLLNEYEAYANWRRTGIPELTPVNYRGNESGGQIPRRLRYRQQEQVANPTNYSAAISAQGPDEFTTRMWWDK